MDEQKYAPLKLEHQLCFPLYACSREIIKQYKVLVKEETGAESAAKLAQILVDNNII